MLSPTPFIGSILMLNPTPITVVTWGSGGAEPGHERLTL